MLQVQIDQSTGNYNQKQSYDQENEPGTNMIFLLPGKPGK